MRHTVFVNQQFHTLKALEVLTTFRTVSLSDSLSQSLYRLREEMFEQVIEVYTVCDVVILILQRGSRLNV